MKRIQKRPLLLGSPNKVPAFDTFITSFATLTRARVCVCVFAFNIFSARNAHLSHLTSLYANDTLLSLSLSLPPRIVRFFILIFYLVEFVSRIFMIIIIWIMYFIGVESPPVVGRGEVLASLQAKHDGRRVYLYCGEEIGGKHPLNTHKNRRAHIAYSFARTAHRHGTHFIRLKCARTDMNA